MLLVGRVCYELYGWGYRDCQIAKLSVPCISKDRVVLPVQVIGTLDF